jgi:uncharacterized protein (DUF2147 family)
MIRQAAKLAGVPLALGAANLAFAVEPPYLGRWARSDGKTRVLVEPCGTAVCAINTWIRPGAPHEKVGDRFVFNLKPAGAKHWSGDAFNPRRNLHLTVNIKVENQRMTTAGCAMGGLMCKHMSWTRLDPPK